MRVKEAASIVVNMPKKKHKHAKKNHASADTAGWLISSTNDGLRSLFIQRSVVKVLLATKFLLNQDVLGDNFLSLPIAVILPKSQPKVIWESNPDLWIDMDPCLDVCRITVKM